MSKLIRNTAIYTIGNTLPQAVSFLLLPIYTRYLSPSDYGIVASMAVLNAILSVVFTLCLERSIYRLYFDYKDIDGQRSFLGTIFITFVCNSLFILSLVFVFKNLVGNIYKSISFHPFYTYAILTCFFSIFVQIPGIYLQVKEKARDYVILVSCQFLTTTLLTLWYVCGLKRGAEGQLKAGLISYIIFFPVYFLITTRIVSFTFNFKVLKNALSFSIPLIPSLLTAWVLNFSNRVFIERYFNLSEVGIYSLGFKLATMALLVLSGFDIAYSPYFYRLANEENGRDENKMKLEKTNNTYALISLLIVFTIAFFSKEIVTFFIDKRYAQTYLMTRIIIFAYFFSGLMGLTSRSILQDKKTKQNMFIAIGVAIINIVLNFVLIPRFGMLGAAWATFFTFLIGYIIHYQYSKRCYFIPLDWNRLLSYTGVAVLVILVYQFLLEKYLYFSLISKLILFCIIFYLTVKWLMKIRGITNIGLSRIFDGLGVWKDLIIKIF